MGHHALSSFLIITILILSFLSLAALGNQIGYIIVVAGYLALAIMLTSLFISRREIKAALSGTVNRQQIIALACLLIFFLSLSIFVLPRSELVLFDENIYQGIALNILHSGSALTCNYGTGYVQKCFSAGLGFDPAGWPMLLAVAFGIFGTGNATSYGLELFLGALSIISVFLISCIITKRREISVLSAAIFALIPELFIWSGTPANPDLPFMAFATIDMLLFLIFIKRGGKRTMILFGSCLAFMTYIRSEALLLVPIFLIIYLTFGEGKIKDTLKKRIRGAFSALSKSAGTLFLLAFFLILIEPQLYTLIATSSELQANVALYLYPNAQAFSASYVQPNLYANLSFFAGLLDDYQIIFLPAITAFAIIGAAVLLRVRRKGENGTSVLILLLCMFLIYFIFYLFYFSGSVLSGTSVRFMLILYPALSMLAAFGLVGVGDFIYDSAKGGIRKGDGRSVAPRYAIYAILILLFFAVPFIFVLPQLSNPTYTYFGFPTNNVTGSIAGLSPYTTQYSKTDLDFIDGNYNLVPNRCLVISELPSVWFMLNRSSTFPAYTDIFTNSSFSNYSCFYLDYDFWCTISPANSTICSFYMSNYKLRPVASESSGYQQENFTIYQILNYTPNSTR